ncbi:hypothetical protein N7509_012771 [Penicillium cosmopolitanum]|uniref:Uncharacterized protein n=1 Tax=Penicillium cosmopolitanum TaxID=1131564 RepID=A0A9W9SD92_9EURO|nr:uncharacterized protein N7509_012771 [Penicillium cosmopolitanum]KAJ5375885.1 hypothetical protein N7509_012771 [Penicillium cosmopolitanum]
MPDGYAEPDFRISGEICKGDNGRFQWDYGYKCWYTRTIQGLINSHSPMQVSGSTVNGAGCKKLGCHEGAQVWICNDLTIFKNTRDILVNSLDVGWVVDEMMSTPGPQGSGSVGSLR